MAYIEDRRGERKGKGWRVRYRDPDGNEKSQSFRTRVDAERWLHENETAKGRGLWIDPARGRLTVAQWAEIWLKTKTDLQPTSRARLDGVVRVHVLPAFGKVPLAEVANAAVREWVASLKASGLGASTIRKSYFALAEMMRAAMADRRVAFNACDDVPLPAEHTGEQRFLDAVRVEELAQAIEPRFRAFVLLAAYGGLRFGELAGLRRSSIDLLRGRVKVVESLIEANGRLMFGPPKTKRSRRTIPLPRRIVAELDRHLATYVAASPDALVFTGPKGAPLRRAGFRRCFWLPATARAGVEGLRVHDLRHTFVALWIKAGENPREVSVRAGHSSVAFTLDRYGHLYDDAEDTIPDRLDALLGDPAAAQSRPSTVGYLRVEEAT